MAAPAGSTERDPEQRSSDPGGGSIGEVFAVALGLGLTSFGGPIAHLGYFRDAYVVRRRWLDEATFADIVALGQALPGPTSSQVGIAVGILRAGLGGGLAAWLGFTLPSALLLLAVAAGFSSGALPEDATVGIAAGLRLAAVAVVAHAVLAMARTLAPDLPRGVLAAAAAVAVLLVPTAPLQVAVIGAGALAGWAVLGPGHDATPPADPMAERVEARAVGRRTAGAALVAYLVGLAGLSLLASIATTHLIDVAWAFYRAGALVFGGGHVVLPLLEASVVAPGWVSEDAFLAGYGAAQAMPGPLFSFAAYLGALAGPGPAAAVLALVAIFLPGALLVVAVLPAWSAIRGRPGARAALRGVNAAVVGILLAALWDPVILTGIRGPLDIAVAAGGFVLLLTGRVPPVVVVASCAAAGLILPGASA